jgi:hypothetical protein
MALTSHARGAIEGAASAASTTDIKFESTHTLKHVMVYNASRAVKENNGFTLHGFVAVQSNAAVISSAPKHAEFKAHHAKTFLLGWNSLYVGVELSDRFLLAAKNNKKLSSKTISILTELGQCNFPTAHLFIQEVMKKKGYEASEIEMVLTQHPYDHIAAINARKAELVHSIHHNIPQKIEQLNARKNNGKTHLTAIQIAHQIKEWQDLCVLHTDELAELMQDRYSLFLWELNELLQLNKTINKSDGGCIFPMSSDANFCKADRIAFEKGLVRTTPYPKMNATYIYEAWQQQLLFVRYMQEKIQAPSVEEKDIKKCDTATTVLRRLARFVRKPNDDNPFQANCSGTTDSLLQAATDAAAKDAKCVPELIEGALLLPSRAKQRMFVWNSPFHQEIVDLFINREFSKNDPRLGKSIHPVQLQKLADNKHYILAVIESWPLEQRKRGLEQLLNKETPLGKVAQKECSDGASFSANYIAKVEKKLRDLEPGIVSALSDDEWEDQVSISEERSSGVELSDDFEDDLDAEWQSARATYR